MNPDDWSSDWKEYLNNHFSYYTNSTVSNYSSLKSLYDDINGYGFYRHVADPYIRINIHSEHVTLYLERPNCDDIVNVEKINPIIVIEGEEIPYQTSFEDTTTEEKGCNLSINNVEAVDLYPDDYYKKLELGAYAQILNNSEKPMISLLLEDYRRAATRDLEQSIYNLNLNPNIYKEQVKKVIKNLNIHITIELISGEIGVDTVVIGEFDKDLNYTAYEDVEKILAKQNNSVKLIKGLLELMSESICGNHVDMGELHSLLGTYGSSELIDYFNNILSETAMYSKQKGEENAV